MWGGGEEGGEGLNEESHKAIGVERPPGSTPHERLTHGGGRPKHLKKRAKENGLELPSNWYSRHSRALIRSFSVGMVASLMEERL